MAKAKAKNWYDNYAFLVEWDGIVKAAFNKCSALSGAAEVIEYAEGGDLVDNKSPGRVSFEDITLERGETDNTELYDWWTMIWEAASGKGEWDESVYKKTITIKHMNRKGETVREWTVYQAWPNKFEVADWDNSANDKHIETLVLCNEGFELAS